jgi:plasmid maintenance system antidote protein VapI
MLFGTLQIRLLEHLRRRIQDGEATERGLARQTGISQPHMHNVLNGRRALTQEIADHILMRLEVSVLDLVETCELKEHMSRESRRGTH